MTTVNVRYMVEDVEAAAAFYTTHLGFTLLSSAAPAFADVARGDLRLLLSGPTSSAGRPMPDGRRPGPGGWNRIELVVEDIAAEVERLRAAGLKFRNDIVTGPEARKSCWRTPPAMSSSSSSPPRRRVRDSGSNVTPRTPGPVRRAVNRHCHPSRNGDPAELG